jgi:2-polyprenyl-6-methoxyphenol hydroxylase-like FAD-dependent oxidoreductase
MTDVIVVGGGPAGASLALSLGRLGLEVELYDQSGFPREKPCGEGLMPGGVEVLRALGLTAAVGGATLNGVCYHVGDGSVRAGFEAASAGPLRKGLGQRRLRLDSAIWNAAAIEPGVVAHQNQPVEGPYVEHGRVTGVIVGGQIRRARLIVAADGASSTLRRKLGLERPLEPRRIGVRAHYQRAVGQAPLNDVQIFVRRGYELYVTPLPDNEVLVAALAHQAAVNGNIRCAFRRWQEAEVPLCRWLEGAEQTTELSGRAPLLKGTAPRAVPPGLVLIGDAATSVDPITAGGMSLALVSAELLAASLPQMLEGDRQAWRRFERARAKAVWIHRLLGATLLQLGQHPTAAKRVRMLMQACPSFMNALVKLASARISS